MNENDFHGWHLMCWIKDKLIETFYYALASVKNALTLYEKISTPLHLSRLIFKCISSVVL